MRPKKIKIERRITKNYGVFGVHQFLLEYGKSCFIVAYGKLAGGWCVVVQNCEMCVNISEPRRLIQNAEILAESFVALKGTADEGIAVAKAIKEHWEGMQI